MASIATPAQSTVTYRGSSQPAPSSQASEPAADNYSDSTGLMTPYSLYYTKSFCNVTLHRGDKNTPVEYYAQSKVLTTTKPVFKIREGSDKGAILSFVRLPWLGSTMHLGLGDVDDSKDDLETLTREKNCFHRSDYHFSHNGIDYDWIKDMRKSAATAYQCVDPNGKVYAVMLSGGACNLSKAGEMKLRNNVEPDLKYLLLAGALGIWTLEGLHYQSLVQAY